MKKKLSYEEKEARRIQEAEKANQSYRYKISFKDKLESTHQTVVNQNTEVSRYSLPIELIKKDLVKNGLYMIFVIVVLIGLNISGISI